MKAKSQHELEQALNALAKRDPVLGNALRKFGAPMSRRQRAGFATLAKIIVGQQISTKAAQAIWNRVKATVGSVSAQTLLETDDRSLRASGLSSSKLKTLKALANAVDRRNINFRTLSRKPDAAVKAVLTEVWGIGDWTADIYLMFGMGRPDVWPVGDLALRTGWMAVTNSTQRIEAPDLAVIADGWRPLRSSAAALLWHAVAMTRP